MLRFVGMVIAVVLLSCLSVSAADRAQIEEQLQNYLRSGDLSGAQKAFETGLQAELTNADARCALGIVYFLQGVERLGQNLHRYGLRPQLRQLPILRLPVPANRKPEAFTYAAGREVLQQFIYDLDRSAQTLMGVGEADVKLRVPVGMVRLDLDADGEATEDETLWQLLVGVMPGGLRVDDEEQLEFTVGFDNGDVEWLIGYTHAMRALLETWLAQDSEPLYRLLAPELFAGATRQGPRLNSGERGEMFSADSIADLVAMIHLINFQLAEPERMSRARAHLLSMLQHSHKSWERILAETDDDHEWIPNPNQTSVIGVQVGEEQIEAWKAFLEESEAALEGTRLVPHWRLPKGTGINLKRVFEEPRGLDLVMWVHGAAALPYAEKGDVISRQSANAFLEAFSGDFFFFAAWFN